MSKEYQTYSLGDWELQSGGTIPNAFLAYQTFGDPSLSAIIYPTWYSGLLESNFWLIGEDKTLNPKKYFIIVIALIGNGQSSSPSNTPSPRPWPVVTFYDNVRAQHQLVTKHLGVSHARAVLGWSMGAGQTYQWATQFPEFMDLVVPFCGAAKTSDHNITMLEGVKSAVLAAKGSASGGVGKGEGLESASEYQAWTTEQRLVGLKALGRVYSGWGFSQAFYREKLYITYLRFQNLEDFMVNWWEAWACSKGRLTKYERPLGRLTTCLTDPENMVAMLDTWQAGDCSKQEPYAGNFEAAMQGIKAKALVLPCQTDLYFPPEDSAYEVQNMRPGIGEMAAFPSIWGHWAGGPGDSKEDVKWLDDKLRNFFEKN
ncbi:MAG: hypothetical protein M1821_009806 [Bathelium mastoideum]|nr:MAG: hypothetical protein M1821_009806 [Bathelium mastoideum]